MVPVVPAYVTAGILAFFWHFWVAILHLIGLGARDPYNGSLIRRNPATYGTMVLGNTCRCIFYVLWNQLVPKSKPVLVSPYHHHSFKRMMTSSGHALDVCSIDDDFRLIPPPGKSAEDYCAVVVTHMLGRDYEWSWIRQWRKDNKKLLVIEDRVQGGFLLDEDPSLADVVLYSGGQDKIPNFMGGGYAIIHTENHPTLAEDLAKAIEALPEESAWDRFMFMVKKIPTVFIYNWRPFCIAVEMGARLMGMNRCVLTDSYRKTNPGFMHQGYLIRPSPAMIQSLEQVEDFAVWTPLQQRCLDTYRQFLSYFPPHLREIIKPFGLDTSCTYFFIRVPNLDIGRKFMANRGIITISNQTFLAIQPEEQEKIENWVTTPWMPAMRPHELQYLAVVVAEMWEKALAGKSLLEDYEEEAVVETAEKAGCQTPEHEDEGVGLGSLRDSPSQCKVK